MPAGRPTDYKPEFNKVAMDLFEVGASMAEIAAACGVVRATVYLWMDQHPEFMDTIRKGKELSQAWWEKQGRINLSEKDFSPTLWFMNVKNRFHQEWRDKHEHEIKAGITINMSKEDEGTL